MTPGRVAVERVLLAGATAFLAINLWTGAPLVALWVGARVAGQQSLSMAAVAICLSVLGALVYGMGWALIRLGERYNRLTGRPEGERRLRWLRSFSVQDGDPSEHRDSGSLLERIVMASVYIAVLAFLVWFFAFAGSPLPNP